MNDKNARIQIGRFSIPPSYQIGESSPTKSVAAIVASFPTMKPYGQQMRAATADKLRIVISEPGNRTRAESVLADFERLKNSSAIARPHFVGELDGYRMYRIQLDKLGRITQNWRITTLDDGSILGIEETGSHSTTLSGNRRLEGMEITYSFRKTLKAAPEEVDRAVVRLLKSFLAEQ